MGAHKCGNNFVEPFELEYSNKTLERNRMF